MDLHLLPAITVPKFSALLVMASGLVLATEIGDPQIERYVSLGIGGTLAAIIFYFYRLNAELLAKRERENADAYKVQAALLIATLQETSRVNTQLSTAVTELRGQLAELSHDQRERYEQDLRDGGRRRYDPKMDGGG